MYIDVISNSPLDTKKIGKVFSKVLAAGDIVLLDGELGAGKTTFISGAAQGLKLVDSLSSPSFTILNIYKVDRNKKLVHADFYRLESIDEILHTGIEDYLYSENNYVFVEWGSKIKDYLKTGYVEIEFKYILKDEDPDLSDVRNNDQLRSILLKSESSRWLRKLEVFKKLLAKNRYI